MMFCTECQTTLDGCKCPDVDERLRDLTDLGGPLTARWCVLCDKHYARCKCEFPIKMIRSQGMLHPLPKDQD